MRLRAIPGVVMLASVGVGLLAGCEGAAPPPENTEASPTWLAPAPETAAATPIAETSAAASLTPEIRAQLMPRRYATLAAELGAKINRIAVPEGGSFRAGQLLVAFDCSQQRAQLEKSQAELIGAEKNLAAHVALEKLNAVGQLERELAESSVALARAEVSSNRAVVGKCEIYAPYAGRIAEQKVREQQFVQAGQPLLDIIDDEVPELEFIVPSRWLAWAKPGLGFTITIDETGKTYPARFTRIGAQVDAVSQSVKVFAAIDGRFPELAAGMSGRIDAQP